MFIALFIAFYSFHKNLITYKNNTTFNKNCILGNETPTQNWKI